MATVEGGVLGLVPNPSIILGELDGQALPTLRTTPSKPARPANPSTTRSQKAWDLSIILNEVGH